MDAPSVFLLGHLLRLLIADRQFLSQLFSLLKSGDLVAGTEIPRWSEILSRSSLQCSAGRWRRVVWVQFVHRFAEGRHYSMFPFVDADCQSVPNRRRFGSCIR